MNKIVLFVCVFMLALTSNVKAQERGHVLTSSLWDSLEIPICWENPEDVPEEEQNWIEDAVARTWEKESSVNFYGWGACSENSPGIRILTADEGPHVKRLGKYLDGLKNGMVLNNSYENWAPSCQTRKRFCNEAIAVHEFGHALGFAHEQNRGDTPDTCTIDPQGTNGDIYVQDWDLDSVMNYCNPDWNGSGNLSDADIDMVKLFYGDDLDARSAQPVSICNVTASSDDGNVAANTIDSNLTTRWSAKGDGQWIEFELCEATEVSRIDLAWYKGDLRTTSFDLVVIEGGTEWYVNVNGSFSPKSSGTTTDLEANNFSAIKANSIKIIGNGNSSNEWNSLSEAVIYEDGAGREIPELNRPTNLRAELAGSSEITLSWVDNSIDEEGHIIEAKFGENDYLIIGTTLENVESFTHSALTAAGDYTYRVKSFDGILRSTVAEVTIYREDGYSGVELLAPSNLQIAGLNSEEIRLTWDDNSEGELGYFVEYKMSAEQNFINGIYLEENAESVTLSNLENGFYDVRVSAYIEGENSPYASASVGLQDDPLDLGASNIEASSDDGNVAANVFDNDYDTRWSAFGSGEFLTIDLGDDYLITGTRIAWHKGDKRQTRFQIEVSNDKASWTRVADSISSGESLALEIGLTGEHEGRYLRIIGLGNEFTEWNSITEVEIWGNKQ